eukprot:312190-Rhodomonas_salina.3
MPARYVPTRAARDSAGARLCRVRAPTPSPLCPYARPTPCPVLPYAVSGTVLRRVQCCPMPYLALSYAASGSVLRRV